MFCLHLGENVTALPHRRGRYLSAERVVISGKPWGMRPSKESCGIARTGWRFDQAERGEPSRVNRPHLSCLTPHDAMADKLRECPSCALDVDTAADVCPYCAYEFPQQRSSRTFMAWLMALLLAWPAFKVLQLLFSFVR